MEKYNRCINNQFSLILLSSLVVNENFLLNAHCNKSAYKQKRGTFNHFIQKDINIIKNKTESLEHVLESSIKHVLIIMLVSLFILKFFIGV